MKKRGISGAKKTIENQEKIDEKNYKFLVISILIIIILGILLYFVGGDDTDEAEQEEYKQNIIGKNACFLDSVGLRYGSNDVFTCDTNDDCIQSLKEYHQATNTPLPSKSILERIECLP